MSPTLLISGPPGCGKTSWILSQIQSHPGPCGYLRLAGYSDKGLAQARDGGIDQAYLLDQCPGLLNLSDPDQALAPHAADLLALIGGSCPSFRRCTSAPIGICTSALILNVPSRTPWTSAIWKPGA